MLNKALFLDRDGVINIDHGYVHKKENFNFIDGIFDLVKMANKHHFKVIVVTNQAGIARGLYSEDDFNVLTEWMISEFNKNNAYIDKVYFSPYHPTEGRGSYKQDHISRKPKPGMLLNSKEDFDIDFSRSMLIGDKYSDMQSGMSVGMGLNLLFNRKIEKNAYEFHNHDKNFRNVTSLEIATQYLFNFIKDLK
jgi:D-glycero-D-manno-heptose 1,7-bisphosphate phosphatase